MQLTSSSDLVKINVGSAATIHAYASWVDNVSGTITPGRTNTASIAGTGDNTVVAGPSSGQRRVKYLNVHNSHASNASLIKVIHSDGTNALDIFWCTLAAGESFDYTDGVGWQYFDATGALHAPSALAASQAQMETATATTVFLTPLNTNWHPGVCKAWVSAGVTGNILSSWNITSLTDTGTGDVAITIATDFSSANYACSIAVQRINSTAAESNERIGTIKTGSQAAGSISLDCWDTTTTTNVIKDPTSWHATMFGDQ